MTRRILLVDDEVTICEALQGLLADHGHQVTYATTGAAALAGAAQADLAICDLRLGEENGLEVIERLKAARPGLKILVFSAYPSIEALQAATDLGVAGFLTKPAGIQELLASVDRAFGDELGPVLLFPGTLRAKLGDMVPFLSEVTVADGPNWLRVRTQIRSVAPACVLVDGGAPEAIDFFDACKRELEGRSVFLLCRDEDFNTARQLVSRLPAAKCLSLGQGLGPLLRAIRTHVSTRRAESERTRSTLAEQLGRCQYAEPLRTGYYCTLAGPCPYGEKKEFQVTIKGKDHHRCPKRPLPLRDAEHVGLMSWRGTPDEKTIIDFRTQAMELIGAGKTHLVINCQGLEWAPFNLFEILADVEQELAHRPDAGVDVINLSPDLLKAFRKMEPYLVGIQVHGRVMVELDASSSPSA